MHSHLNQIKTLLEFYKSKKTRLTALQTILSLTEIPEWISVFNKSDTIKLTLRLLETDELNNEETSVALHVLVNLSSEDSLVEKFLLANATLRLSRIFLNKSDKEIKIHSIDESLFSLDLNIELISQGILINNNNESTKNYEVNKIYDKYVFNDKNNFSSFSHEQILSIPFILMIITNLTRTEHGQKQFFGIEKAESQNLKGLFLLKMLDKYFENIYKQELDFLSSIIANVSALKEARVFLIENKIYGVILAQFDKLNNFKIVNMLRVFRNCCFEFEKFENELLTQDGFMLGLVFKILIEVNLPGVNISLDVPELDKIYFTHFNREKAKEEKESINDLIVDIFLVLTNTENAFPTIIKKGLKKAWDKIRVHLKGDTSLEDRLLVVTNFLDSHPLPETK